MMRYSMLVYITKMGKTLLEAAQYLRTASQTELRAQLLENGRQMLEQIGNVLEQHRSDLLSDAPSARLAEIRAMWAQESPELEPKLEQFIQELPQGISCQVRAVFFAELGEKWDAMESVYEFMRHDPRFDPVIVRTPVGRVVERDGKREQEVIYQDFLTPMGIPSLGYDQYDIEEDCPELAFISQPYASCTLEQFWPENIAKHTRLVYLPYFLPSIVLSDYPQVLCQLPVYDRAWRVIGSNQKHYKYYRRYSHHGGANMLVTGVPKIDPIIKLREQQVPLPTGWECVQGKTAFLWNTWYDINASSLRFFDEVFAWFAAHPDCALIWRPHPMTDTITKLYSPDLYARFQGHIQAVDDAPNMVVDRETSCCPSFAYSSAQVSDHSSMMQQYLLMDKPLLWFLNLSASTTGEEFIGCKWMERAERSDEILAFLERISRGEDRNARLRRETIERDLPTADGRCGERVCEAVWEALHREDGIFFHERAGLISVEGQKG